MVPERLITAGIRGCSEPSDRRNLYLILPVSAVVRRVAGRAGARERDAGPSVLIISWHYETRRGLDACPLCHLSLPPHNRSSARALAVSLRAIPARDSLPSLAARPPPLLRLAVSAVRDLLISRFATREPTTGVCPPVRTRARQRVYIMPRRTREYRSLSLGAASNPRSQTITLRFLRAVLRPPRNGLFLFTLSIGRGSRARYKGYFHVAQSHNRPSHCPHLKTLIPKDKTK